MEQQSADAWTRVDPVFNEGTPVDGRVALLLQVMSDRFARRVSVATYSLWLAPPSLALTLVLKYRLSPDRYVLSPEQHAPATLLPAFTFVAMIAMLRMLVRAWLKLRGRRWTIVQRRLVALRSMAVAVLAAEAAFTALPNLVVLLSSCMYSDGPGSLVRWSSAIRQVLAFVFIAIKCTEIRCLLLVDPTKRQSKVRAIFHACLPDAVVHRTAAFAHQLKATTAVPPAPPSTVPYTCDDAAADAAQPATPPQSTSASRRDDSPPPGAPQRRVAGVEAVESLRADGAVQVRHGDGHARAGDDKRQAASDSATPGQAGVAGGEEVDPEGGGCRRPYGQEEVPVVALSESLLLWAWHVWVVAGVAIGLILAYSSARDRFADFRRNGVRCSTSDIVIGGAADAEIGCTCGTGTLVCRESSAAAVKMSIAVVTLYGGLVVLLAVDLWRGRRRLLGKVYMGNRHTHALLTISRRFSSTSVAIFVLTAIASNLPGWQTKTADILQTSDDSGAGVAIPERLSTPAECATYAGIMFGNPITNTVMAVIAAIELALVWPVLATACKRPMHEHLQRFVWNDDDLAEAKAARDKSALPHDTSKVPMFSMQRAVNLFFWMNLAYKLSDAPHLRGSIDPAVAAALHHSHRPAMALFGLTDLRLFWEHRSDAKATVAWGRAAIVIAWRGTNTLTNAKMDLHVSRTPLPGLPEGAVSASLSDAAGSCTLCGVLGMLRRSVPPGHPMVHSGFWDTYHSSGVAQRLLMHVFSLLEAGEVDREACTVYVCGHSLGGALAVLNSLDIAAGCGLRREQVVVYTIGCPRVGDRAFASYADATVPDTWHIINGRDVVTQWGKLGGCYKSSGQRVLVTKDEQLIVRPSFFEYVLHRLGGRSHFTEHLPGKYLERLALAIGRVERLCQDPRESASIARLLSAAPSQSRNSAGLGRTTTDASRTQSGADRRHVQRKSTRRRASAARGGGYNGGADEADAADGGSEDGNSQSSEENSQVSVWSSIRSHNASGSLVASPVAFGDVIEAFRQEEEAGCQSDHDAVASVISDAATADVTVEIGAAAHSSILEGESGTAEADAGAAGVADLPPVFVNVDAPTAAAVAAAAQAPPDPEATPPASTPRSSSGCGGDERDRAATSPRAAAGGPSALCRTQRSTQHGSHCHSERFSEASGRAAAAAADVPELAVDERGRVNSRVALRPEGVGSRRVDLCTEGSDDEGPVPRRGRLCGVHACGVRRGASRGSSRGGMPIAVLDGEDERPQSFSAVARRMLDHRS